MARFLLSSIGSRIITVIRLINLIAHRFISVIRLKVQLVIGLILPMTLFLLVRVFLQWLSGVH